MEERLAYHPEGKATVRFDDGPPLSVEILIQGQNQVAHSFPDCKFTVKQYQ